MKLSMVRKPSSRSFTLFAPITELRDAVVKENKIYFDIVFHTKTRLSISIQGGSATFKVNQHSKFSTENNLKFDTEKNFSYFTGQHSVNEYFKLSKKQNVEVLKGHILSLMDYLIETLGIEGQINKDTFEIICYTPHELL
jgi:hypothetical protein